VTELGSENRMRQGSQRGGIWAAADGTRMVSSLNAMRELNQPGGPAAPKNDGTDKSRYTIATTSDTER
jgi:hypothetical protein